MILVLLAVSGSITLLVKRHGCPDRVAVDIPVPRSPAPDNYSNMLNPWDLFNSVAMQRIRAYDHDPTGLQLRATQAGRRRGPCSTQLAQLHVDYRINKHKSVVCNGLFLNFLGALLAVSRSNNLTTMTDDTSCSHSEGGRLGFRAQMDVSRSLGVLP